MHLETKNSLLIIFLFILLGTSLARSSESMANLTKKIVTLRGEVEYLSSTLNSTKEELSLNLRSKGQQISQIESQIVQEEIKQKEMLKKISAAQTRLKQQGVDEKLQDTIMNSITNLKEYIQTGIPFKILERLASINSILEQLVSKSIAPELAFSKLWSAIEDELRLTHENAIHRDTVMIHNEEHLATVAKLGLMHMYFQTVDGKVGSLVKNMNGAYEFKIETENKRINLINELLDGLKKQIRQGQYVIPI